MAGPDDELQDAELLGEVELTATLMVAANESEQPLTQDAIDRILGVTHDPLGGTEAAQPQAVGHDEE